MNYVAGLLIGIFTLYLAVHLVTTGEALIIDAVNKAGLSGITGTLLIAVLPGSLIIWFLSKL